jgi:hypothetical protein
MMYYIIYNIIHHFHPNKNERAGKPSHCQN